MPKKKKEAKLKTSASQPTARKKKEPASRKTSSEKKQLKDSRWNKKEKGFPVVGIGASAGGLGAIEKFFKNVPEDPGMAFVVVTHLDPTHISMMPELIQRHTNLKVIQVEDGMKVEKNRVYVIPPDKDMGMMNGTLLLTKPKIRSGPKAPVNSFLNSLAEDLGEKAIGVILSGMGMDGTEGIKAIKGELGMVMAQDPVTCQYDSMPRNAIATGLVDFILAPEKMGERLQGYVMRSVLQKQKARSRSEIPANALKKIHLLLRSATGHDFSAYKESTIARRIQRRMDVHQIDTVSNYLDYLNKNPGELTVLFKEFLIGVTGFFRDGHAFEALKKKALPELFKNKPYNDNLRVWVPACATGEEAYSLAMVIQECMDELNRELNVQIFATDIDEDAINRARAGLYPGHIPADVGPERLEKFFHSVDDSYQVNRKIRDMLVFASQSVIKDPPFTRMELLCCRNLLIYLKADLQKKLLPLFHYSLRPGGVLFLGSSESVGVFSNLFTTVDSKWKIYKRKETATARRPAVDFDIGSQPDLGLLPDVRPPVVHQLSEIIQKHLMEHHTPATVVIDRKGDIAFIHGRTGKYLEPASGGTKTNNINEMAREGLRTRLPALIRSAGIEKIEVRNKLRVRQDGGFLTVNVTVKPLNEPGAVGFYMVLFEELSLEEEKEKTVSTIKGGTERIQELEEELRYATENHQTTVEELETANEELRSINEQYQSANEELQSANEELNSSKEELQSLNEEMETINAELQGKNYELTKANDDMKNLLDSVEIPTVFLDNQLHITRFTSHVTKLIKLRRSDVGRPLSDLVTRLRYKDLIKDAKEVLESLTPKEFETFTKDGRWYLVKIRPYRSADNVIEGLVVTFVDIHAQKTAAEHMNDIIDTVREPLLVLDKALRVERANRSFYRNFQVDPKETEGILVYELGNGQWDIPALRELLEKIIPKDTVFEGFKVDHGFSNIGRKKMLLNARRIEHAGETPESILLAMEDITEKAGDECSGEI